MMLLLHTDTDAAGRRTPAVVIVIAPPFFIVAPPIFGVEGRSTQPNSQRRSYAQNIPPMSTVDKFKFEEGINTIVVYVRPLY